MTNPDLEKLKELAERATPGPWDSYFETGLHPMVITFTENEKGQRALKDALASSIKYSDAEYIAAVSPDVVLELIAEVRLLNKVWNDSVYDADVCRRDRNKAEREAEILRAQLAEAREVLAFYTEQFTYSRMYADFLAGVPSAGLLSMYGEKARAYLEKYK